MMKYLELGDLIIIIILMIMLWIEWQSFCLQKQGYN